MEIVKELVAIEDLRPYLTTGLYSAFEKGNKFGIDEKQIKTLIASAIAEYRLYVPCFTVEDEDIFEALKETALPHLGKILSYQMLPIIPSANTETKNLTERMYAVLMNDLKGGLGKSICNKLKPPPQDDFDMVQISNNKTLRRF